jgi:hypothetical protein
MFSACVKHVFNPVFIVLQFCENSIHLFTRPARLAVRPVLKCHLEHIVPTYIPYIFTHVVSVFHHCYVYVFDTIHSTNYNLEFLKGDKY